MSRLFALACTVTIFSMISQMVLLKEPSERIARSADGTFHGEPSPLFFFHLLKLKKKVQTIEKVPTTPPTADCICVPYYLCDANRTIITDGIGTIDIRYRRCTGDLEVCCRLPNVTTTTAKPTTTTAKPTTMPTTPKTTTTTKSTPSTTTTTSTIPPVIFPNSETPPVVPVCICVLVTQCDPSGIIGTSGEGVLSPRLQTIQCPTGNSVCCSPKSVIQYTYDPPVVASPQICILCGGTIRCSNGVVLPVNVGIVNPVVTYGQQTCPVPTSCCQGINPVYGNGIPVVIGPIRNSGTPQACYCMQSWLCSQGTSVNSDGVGVIDPRLSTCGSADQVCCRAPTIVVPRTNDLQGRAESIMNGEASFSQFACGAQNKTYAPALPYPTDTGKTYFAEFPWMVALLAIQPDGKYLFQCGGSMITNNAVLTAAHCVTKENGRLIARFGQWDLEKQPKDQPLPFQDANIKAIVTHPEYYGGALFNDIAVVILTEPVKQNVNVAPICIPQQGLIFPAGTRCLGSGWGKNSFGGTYQTELRKVELPIVSRADCQNRLRTTKLGPYFQLHSSFMCAGGELNKDTCRGDGGGPLVCLTATGQYFQAGIVSWGVGCGQSNIPAVYTNVAQYTQWISQQLATYGS